MSLEKTTSGIASTQLPLVIREEGPLLETFVRAFYQWMESEGKPTYYLRRFLEDVDVDQAEGQFLVLIKEKFLKGVRLGTEGSTRLLVKHAADLYNARGTERGLDLFFRALYDQIISIYYPKDDLFRLSDGVWKRPVYLELELMESNRTLVGKKIRGNDSGATAFVDSVVRRNVDDSYPRDTLYLSSLSGDFRTGEKIVPTDGSLHVTLCPRVTGSLNSVTIPETGVGIDHVVGDQVLIQGTVSGVLGRARVAEIKDQTGLITLTVDDGGYGYTNAASVIVSERIVTLSNVTCSNSQQRAFFLPAEDDRVTQSLGSLWFRDATWVVSAGDVLSVRDSGNNEVGTLTVDSILSQASNAGLLSVGYEGTPTGNTYLMGSDSLLPDTASGGFVDQKATARVMGVKSVVVELSSGTLGSTFSQGNPTFPRDATPICSGTTQFQIPGTNTYQVTVDRGFLKPGALSGNAVVSSVRVAIGVTEVSGDFVRNTIPIVSGRGTQGYATKISDRVTPENRVGLLTDTEAHEICTDGLANVGLTQVLSSFSWNGGTYTTPLREYLTYANTTIGSISTVVVSVPGTTTDESPIAQVLDDATRWRNSRDQTVSLLSSTSDLVVGEIVYQDAGGRGRVVSSNSTRVTIASRRVDSPILPTTNSSTVLVGVSSGSQSNVSMTWVDSDRDQIGVNARLDVAALSGNGAIASVEVLDSGFSFTPGETVVIVPEREGPTSGIGVAVVEKQGVALGYYAQKGGFLSDQKRLYDGTYWQEFSYEVSSGMQLREYEDQLRSTVHPAGMAIFGRYVRIGEEDVSLSVDSSVMTVSNSSYTGTYVSQGIF